MVRGAEAEGEEEGGVVVALVAGAAEGAAGAAGAAGAGGAASAAPPLLPPPPSLPSARKDRRTSMRSWRGLATASQRSSGMPATITSRAAALVKGRTHALCCEGATSTMPPVPVDVIVLKSTPCSRCREGRVRAGR